jgi:ABC-type lipopolysaccharide export system ATPase subunit
MKHILEADSISLEFSNRNILSDIYLKCETGKVTGLLGRNGAGKSCLMRIIYGQMKTDNGSVRFDKVYNRMGCNSPHLIRYLPQFNFIPGSLSLERIFSDFETDYSGLEKFMPEFAGRQKVAIKKLSGGERRLVEMYVILTSKTRFVLMDEPFTHVMPLHIEKIKQLILSEKANKGILITDHMFRQVVDICDDLYVLVNGKTHLTKDPTDIEKLGYAHL